MRMTIESPRNGVIRWHTVKEYETEILTADVIVDPERPYGTPLDPERAEQQKWWQTSARIEEGDEAMKRGELERVLKHQIIKLVGQGWLP